MLTARRGVVIGLVLGFLTGGAAWAGSEAVAATVNGTPIPRDSVRRIVRALIASDARVPSSAEIDDAARNALDSLIALELLYQEAQRRQIVVSDDRIDAELRTTRAQFPDEKSFLAALEEEGLTEARLRDELRKTLTVDRLRREVVWSKVTIPPGAAEEFYRENLSAFTKAPPPPVRGILILVPRGATPAEREQALQKAREVQMRAHGGEDFAKLAKERSDDAKTARNGGLLGSVASLPASSPLRKAAEELTPGAVSAVVESPDGYHVLKRDPPDPAKTEPFDKVRDRIVRVLETEARQQQEAEFVARLRTAAKIDLGAESAPAPTGSPEGEQ